VLDEQWWTSGEYEIIDGKLYMYNGVHENCPPNYDCYWSRVSSEWLNNEYIYQFEADIYVSSSMVGERSEGVGLYIYFWEPEHSWQINFWLHMTVGSQQFVAYLVKDETVIDQVVIGPGNPDEWYSLSITLHNSYVTVVINGDKTDIFLGSFQKPPLIDASACEVQGGTHSPNDVEYYIDNIVAFTSTGPMIDDVLESIDEWTEGEDPDLYGVGEGQSADGRLTAFENMIQNARDLFNDGDIEAACDQLAAASRKCDGVEPPPDFVEGDAVPYLHEMLAILMNDFGCE
jgi:hypothetical protein